MADNFSHLSDDELLEKFYESHNNYWLGILLPRYTYLLLGVCMKYLKNGEDAKDSVQQIFIKAITELPKHKVTHLKSWIYIVAKNHCLMRIRSTNGKMPKELNDNIADHIAEYDEHAELIEKENTLNLVEHYLDELNHEQQTCIKLFYLQKLSYQQIVDKTGFSVLQVKSYIQNGKRNLKLMLESKINKQ